MAYTKLVKQGDDVVPGNRVIAGLRFATVVGLVTYVSPKKTEIWVKVEDVGLEAQLAGLKAGVVKFTLRRDGCYRPKGHRLGKYNLHFFMEGKGRGNRKASGLDHLRPSERLPRQFRGAPVRGWRAH